MKNFNVVITSEPDILFFSCFGIKYLSYKNCKKVFWAGENIRPDFNGADYCITFDYNTNPNHYRYPLWAMCIEENLLTKKLSESEIDFIIKEKEEFCAMLVSYCRAKKRKTFFKYVNDNYKKINSGGKCLNNMGNQKVIDALDFFKPYKFSLSFENSSHPGYSTEKIINAFKANCIPIYWGDEELKNELNPKRYISLHDFNSEKECLEYIKEIDNNVNLYKSIIKEPFLINGKIPECYKIENFNAFLNKVITDDLSLEKSWNTRFKHYFNNYYIKYIKDRTMGFN